MYQDNQWKYFAILNRNITPGQGMNVLAHGVNALAHTLRDHPSIRFSDYRNAAHRKLGDISFWPYIVLESSSSEKLKNLLLKLQELSIPTVEFYSSMLAGSNDEQMQQTAQLREGEGELLGLFCFGSQEQLQSVMKKFSVFKGFRDSSAALSQAASPKLDPGMGISRVPSENADSLSRRDD